MNTARTQIETAWKQAQSNTAISSSAFHHITGALLSITERGDEIHAADLVSAYEAAIEFAVKHEAAVQDMRENSRENLTAPKS
jgi:hypothetical protein